MKKIISSILVFAMLFTLVPTAFATNAYDYSINLGQTAYEVEAGKTIAIPVYVKNNNATSTALGMFQIGVNTPTGFTTTVEGSTAIPTADIVNASKKVSYANDSGITFTNDAAIMTITYTAPATAGTYDITFDSTSTFLIDSNNDQITSVDVVGATITVKESAPAPTTKDYSITLGQAAYEVEAGKTVVVPVYVKNNKGTSTALGMFQIGVNTPTGFTTTVEGSTAIPTAEIVNASKKVSYANDSGITFTNDAAIMTITYTAPATAGTYDITFDSTSTFLIDSNNDQITSVDVVGATITVKAGTTPDPVITRTLTVLPETMTLTWTEQQGDMVAAVKAKITSATYAETGKTDADVKADVTVVVDGTTATVSYEYEAGKKVTDTIALTLGTRELTGITATPAALTVPVAEQDNAVSFVKSNVTVTANYSEGTPETVAASDYTVEIAADKSKATIAYDGKTAEVTLTFDIAVKVVETVTATPGSITVPAENSGNILEYVKSKIESVVVKYEGDTNTYNVTTYTVELSEQPDGTFKATVKYEGKTDEIIVVLAETVDAITTSTKLLSIENKNWKGLTAEELAAYIKGLDADELTITATMSNGANVDITAVADIIVNIEDEVATISYGGKSIQLELNLKSSSGGGNGGGGASKKPTGIGGTTVVTPAASIFEDLSTNHFAYEAIKVLKEKGIVSGDGKKVYPETGITREETAKLALAINDIAVVSGLSVNTKDADKVSDWAKDIMATAQNKGILSGYTDGTIRPLDTITRGEMVAIIIRALNVQTKDAATNFSDVPADLWSAKYISTASALGFVNGYEDGTFKPEQNITRAEAFVIYYRVYKFRNALNVE